ncbi:polyhydroxyalkanoate depolymerase [Paraburkholderia caribensis]|uniref:polyhydroxyalkanoate depolymerase n=1 Tax=Paraburkholderia caribensis TaxID=75105 RepID=UPI0031D4DD29
MWYGLFDAQRRAARALAGESRNASPIEGPQQTLWNFHKDGANAFSQWLLRTSCAYDHAPPFAIRSVCRHGRQLEVVETSVETLPVGTLRKFTCRRGAAEPAESWPVMLCPPLAGHHAVMLRETVETLLEERDVFITDWADARDVPPEAGPLSLDDYVLALKHFICTAARAGHPLHIMAVCQATVPVVAAAALLLASSQASPLASVSLLGGPIDTRVQPTLIDRFACSHPLDWFRRNVIDVVPAPYRGAGRRVYPGFVQQAAIVAAHPERQLRLESAYWSNWFTGNMPDAMRALRSLNEYAAVLDMAECYFLDIIRVVFHEYLLPRQMWSVAGRRVATQALRHTPLCTIEGDSDDIAGPGQTHCAHALCRPIPLRSDAQLTVSQCNHYDLFTGSRWRDLVHPELCQFWHRAQRDALATACMTEYARQANDGRHA